jgi:hypothetical protein
MQDNGRLRVLSPAATDEEAAAIVAAVERFIRATAPQPAPAASAVDPWRHAALLEGVERDAEADLHEPWINT